MGAARIRDHYRVTTPGRRGAAVDPHSQLVDPERHHPAPTRRRDGLELVSS
jgi:hypothetical protein